MSFLPDNGRRNYSIQIVKLLYKKLQEKRLKLELNKILKELP